jgi:hypothetical protein
VTKFIATYKDAANNIESRIAIRQDGKFAVTMFDVDAEQVFPMAHIYADLNKAHEMAKKIVGGAA